MLNFKNFFVNIKLYRLSRNEGGASAIEFAIVAPVLLLFLFGMLAVGLYIGTAHGVAQLAADAARASIAGLTDAERTAIAERQAMATAGNYSLVSPEHLTVQAAADPADATQFVVVLRYDASDLPIWAFSGLVPLPDKTIVRSATIKRGGY